MSIVMPDRSRQRLPGMKDESLALLESKLPLKDAQLISTHLVSPALTGSLSDSPTALNTVHQAYWKALKAHQQAASKYTSLKSEVEALSTKQVASSTDGTINSQAVAEKYVPLLHQREMLRKLKVIENAYSSISKDSSSSPATAVFDDFIRQRAGEMPLLPTTRNQHDSRTTAAADRTFELQKAALAAKKTVDDHHNTDEDLSTNGQSKHKAEAQIYALQQARDELIAWIEDKLSLIGKAQAENAKPVESLTVTGDEAPIPVSKSEIGQIYDQYIATRKSLLQAIQNPNNFNLDSQSGNAEVHQAPNTNRKPDEAGALACNLLPYISHLSSFKQDDQAKSRNTVFTKQQLEKAETTTTQLLRRLADESHLVLPGAEHGKDWGNASQASLKVVANDVLERVQAGLEGLHATDETIRRLNSLPRTLVLGEGQK